MDKSAGFKDIIRSARKSRKVTQAELAKAIGLERTSIVNIEAGNQTVSVLHLQAIMKYLGYEIQISIREIPREPINFLLDL